MFAENHRGAFIFGMLVGMVAGALVALFATPKSGPQLREGFKQQAGGVGQKVTGVSTTMRGRSEDLVGGAVDRVTRLANRGGPAEEVVVVSETMPETPQAAPGTQTPRVAADETSQKEPADAS